MSADTGQAYLQSFLVILATPPDAPLGCVACLCAWAQVDVERVWHVLSREQMVLLSLPQGVLTWIVADIGRQYLDIFKNSVFMFS